MADRLSVMFEMQEKFMKELVKRDKDKLPASWPIDLADKESQQICREIMLRSVEEAFEALGHLKNWKPHKETLEPNVDKEKLLEEFADTYHYMIEFLILIGVTPDELYHAFVKKDYINHHRLKVGY